MDSNFVGPVNIGSEEMVTIDQLVDIAAKVADKTVEKAHITDSNACLLYTSPSPRDATLSRMPSSA